MLVCAGAEKGKEKEKMELGSEVERRGQKAKRRGSSREKGRAKG